MANAPAHSRVVLRCAGSCPGLSRPRREPPAASDGVQRGARGASAGSVKVHRALLAAGLGASALNRRHGRTIHSRLRRNAAADSKSALRQLDERLAAVVGAEIDLQPKEEVAKLEGKVQELLDSGGLGQQLRMFGNWTPISKEELSLEDLSKKGIDASKLLSPEDDTEENVRKALLALLTLVGLLIIAVAGPIALVRFVVAATLFVGVDQLVNGGLWESLLVDGLARTIDGEYATRIARHEAGHFMVAYFIGILPKAYTMSTWEALQRYNASNVQAGTVFCDSKLQQEVSSGSLSGKSLDQFICIALGGVAVEYLKFGAAKGGKTDIAQVDNMLQAVGMSQRQGSAQVRWALLNVVEMMRTHLETHEKVAQAMLRSASVGECISIIEDSKQPSAAA